MRKLTHYRASAAAVMLAVSVFIVCPVASMDRNSEDSLANDGRSLFYQQITKEFGAHPQAFSLINRDIGRILDAKNWIPDLYDAESAIVCLKTLLDRRQ